MNVPKAIEKAVAKMFRSYGNLGAGVLIRPWQSLDYDGSWKKDIDREFPVVDIRFAPERTEENQHTFISEGTILFGTFTQDDKSHSFLSAMYGGGHDVLRDIFRGFLGETGVSRYVTRYNEFKSLIENELGSPFALGGITFAEPLAPYDDGGVNKIGIGYNIHFSL